MVIGCDVAGNSANENKGCLRSTAVGITQLMRRLGAVCSGRLSDQTSQAPNETVLAVSETDWQYGQQTVLLFLSQMYAFKGIVRLD